MYEIFVGRDSEDKKKFGKKGTFLLGKNYVKMGQTSSLSNEVLMDVAKSHVVFVTGKRGSGKCVAGDTLIALDDGRITPIKQLEKDNSRIVALNENRKTVIAPKTSFYKRKASKLLKITTATGKSIKLTPEHPLLSPSGWTPAANFKPGQKLATPTKTPNFGEKTLPESEIKLLAYLTSAKNLNSKEKSDKTIPPKVMQLSKKHLSQFLRTAFNCDGTIRNEKTADDKWKVTYPAPNRKTAEQMSHILLKYGILCKIAKPEQNSQSYELVISGQHALTLLQEISFSGKNQAIQKQALTELAAKKQPNQKTPNSTTSPIARNQTQTVYQLKKKEANPSNACIFWDAITEIQEISGKFEVYDLTVPRLHNFVANDIIVHNSYSMASIAEGMMTLPEDITSRISIVMFDTMGIYWTMKYENLKDQELVREWNLKCEGLNARVYVPAGHFEKSKKKNLPVDAKFSIKPSELSVTDWCSTFDIEITSPVGSLIGRILSEMKNKAAFDIDDVITAIRSDNRTDESTKSAAENLFLTSKEWELFDKKGISFSDLISPGQISIVDVSGYASAVNRASVRALVIGLVCKKLFSERMEIRKAEEHSSVKAYTSLLGDQEPPSKEMPLIWIMVDEAHEFLPKQGFTPATDALQTLLREGRQPGISLVLASQQPGQIHTDVMTQSDIVIAHHLTAKIDIDALGALMQSYMRSGLDKALADLPDAKGAAILFDDTNERLYPVRIRPRITWHGGGSPTVLEEKRKFEWP